MENELKEKKHSLIHELSELGGSHKKFNKLRDKGALVKKLW